MNVLRHLFKRLDQMEIEMDSSWSRERSQVIADIRQKIIEFQIDLADLDVPSKRDKARARDRADTAARNGASQARAADKDDAPVMKGKPRKAAKPSDESS
jgi:hypothetical protein